MTGSEDLSETRNLVEEINMRTKQLPLTKQDSYANAIYNSATRAQQARKGIKKQGSYEAAVESGAKNQAAAKRTKQILQIRKQDVGGRFGLLTSSFVSFLLQLCENLKMGEHP